MKAKLDATPLLGGFFTRECLRAINRTLTTGCKGVLAFAPFPDLDRPMDFKTLKLGGASDTSAWGPQFRDEGDEDMLSPLDLGGGHLVLARRSCDVSELRH